MTVHGETISSVNAAAQRIHRAIELEIDRRHDEFAEEAPFTRVSKRWYRKGSAGRALGWFDEIAEANPSTPINEVVQMLFERCEQELASRPRFYTRRHLAGVLEIVWSAHTAELQAA